MPRRKVKVEATVAPDITEEEKEHVDRIANDAHRKISYIVNENEPPEEPHYD